jgi:hypothetical protein
MGRKATVGDYVVCWVLTEAHWEVISGEDAMQVRVSELIDLGISEEDIVVGQITEDTK